MGQIGLHTTGMDNLRRMLTVEASLCVSVCPYCFHYIQMANLPFRQYASPLLTLTDIDGSLFTNLHVSFVFNAPIH